MTASADEHPDLFWAIRGGGGNFGVVTSFVFRLHPVSTVYAGPMLWPIERAGEVLRWFRDFILAAARGPRRLLRLPQRAARRHRSPRRSGARPSPRSCGATPGPLEDAEARFAPIRAAVGGPIADLVGPVPFPALQGLFDPLLPAGIQSYWRADFVRTPHGRGDRAPRRARLEPADAPLDRAPLSARRRGPARRPRRDGVQLPGRRLRRGRSSASTWIRPTPGSSATGPSPTGTPLHPYSPRPGRTSTS